VGVARHCRLTVVAHESGHAAAAPSRLLPVRPVGAAHTAALLPFFKLPPATEAVGAGKQWRALLSQRPVDAPPTARRVRDDGVRYFGPRLRRER